MVELLLDRGADHDAKDNNGNTALDHARKNGYNVLSELLEKETKSLKEERHIDDKKSKEVVTGLSMVDCKFSSDLIGLQKLYSIITNPNRSTNFAALESYLKNDLGVINATELFDYLELSEIMDTIRCYLRI